MKQILADVEAFHRLFSVPVADGPSIAPPVRVDLRRTLHKEEFDETDIALEHCAHVYRNPGCFTTEDERVAVEAVADGIIDLIYVLAGTLKEFGIPGDRVWDEVHAANMRKVGGGLRGDGKVSKPENWVGPDLAKAVWGDQ